MQEKSPAHITLALFAERARAIADACDRASRGTETNDDFLLIQNAYEEARRYSTHTQGLLVEGTNLWATFASWVNPECDECAVPFVGNSCPFCKRPARLDSPYGLGWTASDTRETVAWLALEKNPFELGTVQADEWFAGFDACVRQPPQPIEYDREGQPV